MVEPVFIFPAPPAVPGNGLSHPRRRRFTRSHNQEHPGMSNPLHPSDPRRGRRTRRQRRPEGRPSDIRRAALRRARLSGQPDISIANPVAKLAAEHEDDSPRVTEAAEAVNRALRRAERRRARMAALSPDGALNDTAEIADEQSHAAVTHAAVALGAELWRRQVVRAVSAIADKVEGMANMAGAELAELGQKLQQLTGRLHLLELSNSALAAKVKSLARRGPRKATRGKTTRPLSHKQRGDLAVAAQRRRRAGADS